MESECEKKILPDLVSISIQKYISIIFKIQSFLKSQQIFNPNHKNLHNPKEKTITNSFEDLVAQFFADPKKPGSGFKPV